MSSIHQVISTIRILKGVQVLVVDNDRDSCYLYAVLLNSLGATVITTSSVREALESLNWFLPNLLICEMRFRGESIDTLTTKLSEMEASGDDHIPAIAITTWMNDSLARTLDAGFGGYLLKPIDLDQLVSTIRSLLACKKTGLPLCSVGPDITVAFADNDETAIV